MSQSATGAIDEATLLTQVQEDAVVKLLQKTIQFETVNPPGNEIELARWVENYFREAGLEPELVEYEPNRANLVTRVRGSGERPGLIFSAHFDTGRAGELHWTFSPFSGTLHEGRIYGRGAADMKSGLAAMAEAAVILARAGVPLRGDLIVAFTSDEGIALEGAKRLVEGDWLDGAGALLVSEPSSLDVFITEKGALWLKCRAEGHGTHGAMPHLGHNAIFEMAAFLQRLRAELDLGTPDHPLLGNPTFNVGTIRGGEAINLSPDVCEAELDIRLVAGQDYKEAIRKVEALASEHITVALRDWKPPVETSPDEEIVGICLDAVQEITTQPVSPKGVAYFSDGAILANRLKLPFVNIGPGPTEMTHQPDEYAEVSKLTQAVKIYLLIAARYLA